MVVSDKGINPSLFTACRIEELKPYARPFSPEDSAAFYFGGVAVALCHTIANELAKAQEPPSISGSYPLHGISGATAWINSRPLTAKQLKGKVVLVDFWAYSCINCIRTVPYMRAWADKYKDSGLVVIGVHTPEFEFEGQLPNVQKAVQKFGITYPVALDSDHAIWNAFHNQYWPAHYFIDATGKVRYEHFGEGEYEQSERWIQELLKEANAKSMPVSGVNVHGEGVQAAVDLREVRSPETYIGYSRAQHFASPGGFKREEEHHYVAPLHPPSTNGDWTASGWIIINARSSCLGPERLCSVSMRATCIWCLVRERMVSQFVFE